MDLWFTLWLLWGYVRADSFEVEDGEPHIPCVPILYKCYTTDDCCSGTCVRAKWSKHLVCLVAGYKEDIKLDRIGLKKVGPMDLEYLKNMYGFAVDYNNLEQIRDFETILDPFYSSTTANYDSTTAITDSLNVKPVDISGSTDATANYDSTAAFTDSLNVKPVDISGSTDATANYDSTTAVTDSLNEKSTDISGSTDAIGNYGKGYVTSYDNYVSNSQSITVHPISITDSLFHLDDSGPNKDESLKTYLNSNNSTFFPSNTTITNCSFLENNRSLNVNSTIILQNINSNVNQSLNFETTLNTRTYQLNITVNSTLNSENNSSEISKDDFLSQVSNYSSIEFSDENRKQYDKKEDLILTEMRKKRSLAYSLKEENNVEDNEENNMDDIENREYSDSYIDPFSSYIGNINRPTLVDNITSQIKQSDSDFKSLSYNSLETLLQNLTGYEFQLPNFSWPLRYNKTSTTVPPMEPVTVPERLWNLLTHVNSSDDYSDLDFGETYNMLKGNYSEQWLQGETHHEGLGDFSGVNRFLSSFHFFKEKHNVTSVSSWQKVLGFVHREKNTTGELRSDNATIVVSVKDKSGNKSAWTMLTGLFHSDHDTIKLDFIPRNVSESNNVTTLEDFMGDFKDGRLAANISYLLWSILNRNKTNFKFNQKVGSNAKDKLKTKKLKSSRFIEEVKFIDKTYVEENSIALENIENTTKIGKWEKFKKFFKKNKNKESKHNETTKDSETNHNKDKDNVSLTSKASDDTDLEHVNSHEISRSDSETHPDKIDIARENQTTSLWNRFKNVLFKSVTEAVTSTEPSTPATDMYDFMKRYWDWSARRNRYLNRTKEQQHSAGTIGMTEYTDADFWNLWSQGTEVNTLSDHRGFDSENTKSEFVDGSFYRNIVNLKRPSQN